MRSVIVVLIAISDNQRTGLSPYLRKHLRAAAGHLKSRLQELSIALVDERAMADLHWRFMGIRGPTDVLTFELERRGKDRVTAGEIIVCVPVARRQSGSRGVSLRQELLLYCLHGMLHLCGHDDRTRGAFLRMHRTEDMILSKLGVGKVFARGEARAETLRTPVRSRRTQRRSKGTVR